MLLSACATAPVMDAGETITEDDPDLRWPVDGAIVSQRFRPKASRMRRRHQGIDLAGPINTPIYAADHGVVVYSGAGFTGYGRLVILKHVDQEHFSYYAHLNRYKVERGDVVQKGDLVGLMGNSGRSTGVHLHFELRKGEKVLNPLDWLPTTPSASQQANP